MARTYDYPVTGGQDKKDWYSGARVAHVIRERVTGTGKNAYLTLTKQIPANSRIIMATMRAASAVSFSLGQNQTDTTAAQALTTPKLAAAMVLTAPSSVATNATTAALVTIPAGTAAAASGAIASGIAANATASRSWDTTAAATNCLILPTTLNLPATLASGTAAKSVHIMPYGATTAADTVYRFCGTVTTSYTFGTSTSDSYSFDVQIVYEEYPESPAV